jgi:hypothetical protein
MMRAWHGTRTARLRAMACNAWQKGHCWMASAITCGSGEDLEVREGIQRTARQRDMVPVVPYLLR